MERYNKHKDPKKMLESNKFLATRTYLGDSKTIEWVVPLDVALKLIKDNHK